MIGIRKPDRALFYKGFRCAKFELKSSYAMWEDHKLYGVGFGHWAREYPNYISPAAREPDLTIPHVILCDRNE